MIKQLISDLISGNISLTVALTKAKLIEYEINNSDLRSWLQKELSGYEFNDKTLPKYRKVHSPIELIAQSKINGSITNIPVALGESFHDVARDFAANYQIIESISSLEGYVSTMQKSIGYIKLTTSQLAKFEELYRGTLSKYSLIVINGERKIPKANYQNVLEQTKQKLIDVLVDIDRQFPNLEDGYKMTPENKEKVSNIVTTNIHGGHNQIVVAAGETVTQKDIKLEASSFDYDSFEDLGVKKTDIETLKNIVKEHSSEKSQLSEKIFGWLGDVSASVAASGFYEKLPLIAAKASQLLSSIPA